MDPIERAVPGPQIKVVVQRRARRGLSGSPATKQPALRMYIRPLTTSRKFTVRLLPPRLAGGIRGSISALLVGQVRRIAPVGCGRSERGFPSSTSAAAPQRIGPPPLNHK